MLSRSARRWPSGSIRRSLPLVLITVFCTSGCQNPRSLRLDDPELAAFMRLIMPARIEIQHYLTKPFDFGGSGDPDGLEVILATLDSFGDPIKCVGTFHFELHVRRMASGDELGKQIARWSATIDSDETLLEHWDRYSHYYIFRLKLASGALPPEHYILTARLVTPAGEKLFDDYEFTYGQP